VIRLVAFDLDGTLLHKSNIPSQQSWDVVRELLDRGISVASISGRNFDRNQIPFRDDMDVANALSVGAYNGAMAFAPHVDGRRELLYAQRLETDVFDELMQYLAKYNINFVYCRCDLDGDDIAEVYITDRDTILGRAVAEMTEMTYEVDHDLLGRIGRGDLGPSPKIMILPDPEKLEKTLSDLERIFGDRVYMAWAVAGRVEIMHPQVDKAVALKAIADHVGVSMDEVMAIGDGNNDLPMLKAAGVGVLMGNADDATKADVAGQGLHVTTTVEEDGFAAAVRKFVLDG